MSRSMWQQQWELFSPNFYDGAAHVDLGAAGILKLAPGAGFGDLSHPTTRLMLRMMEGKTEGKTIVDIGCGCGILSLAAEKMGAKEAWGIDIDLEAIAHAQENRLLNGLTAHFGTALPTDFIPKAPLLVCINMIFSEQKTAWGSQKILYNFPKTIIASGILQEMQEAYLEQTAAWGWRLSAAIQENNWICFHFNN